MKIEAKPAGVRLRKKPEINSVDFLVVGAGPTGCSAAMAAKAAGLHVCLLERESVWSRARAGCAGDFELSPAFLAQGGSALFEGLLQEPTPQAWSQALKHHQVPLLTGAELVSLSRSESGSFLGGYYLREEGHLAQIEARYVLMATGCGRPFRLQGDWDSSRLVRSLDQAKTYLGRPVAVVGSSRAAIEAVIALSKARRSANDPSPLMWAGLGPELPKIPYDLRAAFQLAYLEYGNIVFYPRAGLVGQTRDAADQLRLCIRVGSREDRGLWLTEHVNLPYEDVLVFGDFEPRLSWLEGMGLVLKEVDGSPRPLLQPSLQTRVPGLFLAGSALCPGYLVAPTLAKPKWVARPDRLELDVRDALTVIHSILGLSVEPEKAEPARSSGTRPAATLVHRGPKGLETIYPLSDGQLTIGKQGADVVFPDDTMLADVHASVVRRGGQYLLRDEASATGVFLRLPPGEPFRIMNGDLLRIGQQFLVFTLEAGLGLVRHFDREGQEREFYRITDEPLVLGREACTLLDEHDTKLAARHLVLWMENEQIRARDLHSPNGSYVRLLKDTVLVHGQVFLVGQEQLQFLDSNRTTVTTPPVLPQAPSQASGAVLVTLVGRGGPYPGQPGQTLREIFQQNGLTLPGDCLGGACGLDAVRIVSGIENVAPCEDVGEQETLKLFCGTSAGSCRLACKMRIYGPVRAKLVEPLP